MPTCSVLTDKDNIYADKLGLTFTLPEKLKETYSGFGIDLEQFNGNDTWELPMSGRFLIDTNGVIRSNEVHPAPYHQTGAKRYSRIFQISELAGRA